MTSGDSISDALKKEKHVVPALVAAAIVLHHYHPQKRGARVPLCRKRCDIIFIFAELGSLYTQRAYRLSQLHRFLLHQLQFPINNGGSPYDLAIMHGILYSSVYESVWMMVDTIYHCNELAFKFPSSQEEQHRLTRKFGKKYTAGFDCCHSAIDGILICSGKPTCQDCTQANCGETKFYCWQKEIIGLTMMGTVDYAGWFIDVEIWHPGATSDYLCFKTSTLKAKLIAPNFLAQGLVLVGEHAYIDTEYMIVTYKNPKIELGEDDFNFFHLQVRINVECAFGMFVHQWGILLCPLSSKIGIQKTTALVMALYRLYNYCINQNIEPGIPLKDDVAYNGTHGAFELETTCNHPNTPTVLLGWWVGGGHFDFIHKKLHWRPILKIWQN